MDKVNNFDRETFSNILKKIYGQYPNQRDFAKIANVNRTYISKYINKKLEVPPSAKILRKLSKSSKGLTTYQELMRICGYLNDNEIVITIQNESRLEHILNLIDGLSVNEFNLLREKIKNAKIKINKGGN